MLIRFALTAAMSGLLTAGMSPARAADCAPAIQSTAQVAAIGDAAVRSDNYLEFSRSANAARFAAIDAQRQAKTCGCTEAEPQLENLTDSINLANRAFDLSSVRAHGARIKKEADEAIETLRRCSKP